MKARDQYSQNSTPIMARAVPSTKRIQMTFRQLHCLIGRTGCWQRKAPPKRGQVGKRSGGQLAARWLHATVLGASAIVNTSMLVGLCFGGTTTASWRSAISSLSNIRSSFFTAMSAPAKTAPAE